jgi:hypothetical protein
MLDLGEKVCQCQTHQLMMANGIMQHKVEISQLIFWLGMAANPGSFCLSLMLKHSTTDSLPFWL